MKQRKYAKRFVAAFLSLCMQTTVLSVLAVPVSAAPSDLPENVATVVELDNTVPKGFDNAKDPFELAGTKNTKVLHAFDELAFSRMNGKMQEYSCFDTFKNDATQGNTTPGFSNDPKYFKSHIAKEQNMGYDDIRYIQSDAADLNGDGTKESAVYVGLQLMDSIKETRVVTWYVNMETGVWSDLRTVPNTEEKNLTWVGTLGDGKALFEFYSLNFMSIAAGDFNGDGVDTWFVYYPGGGANYAIYEYRANVHNDKNDKRIFLDKDEKRQSFLNWSYMRNEKDIQKSKTYYDILSADLAVGDFDGDGYDDLAVLSYTNSISNKYKDSTTIGLYTPYLTVGYGSSSGIPLKFDKEYWVFDGNDAKAFIPLAPSVSAGDLDRNGKDEIVVAGYYGERSSDKGKFKENDNARSSKYMNVFTYQANKGTAQGAKYQKLDTNGWIKVRLGKTAGNDRVWQPMAVKCGALDGSSKEESVFIGGSIYKWNGSKLEHKHTPDYFTSKDSGADGWIISVPFITSVAAGVFDENMEGKEQFVYTLGLKRDSRDSYRSCAGIIGHNGGSYYDSNPSKAYTDGTMVVTAVDRDNDMFQIRFRDKRFAWSDPNVISILQAAPYFGELGGYEDFSGGTAYNFETSYQEENGTTHSRALGVGGKAEFSIAGAADLQIKAGYAGEWSSQSVTSEGANTAFEIEATAYNTVIVKRTPVFEYNYDVYDTKTKTWQDSAYSIWITDSDVFFSMSIEDYNAFVDVYNNTLKDTKGFKPFEKLTKDTANAASLFGNEGNPYAYASDMKGFSGKPTHELSHNGNLHSINLAKSFGNSVTDEKAEGFSLEVEFAVGLGDAVKLGGYASTEQKWGTTKTVSTTKTENIAGKVAGINNKDLAKKLGVSETLLNLYNFKWTFGTWDIDLGGAGKVPVYGYNTYNVSSPTAKVTDFSYKLAEDGKSINFSWSKPKDTNNTVDGYYLYKVEGSGDLVKCSDSIITDTTYTLTDFDKTKDYTFAVKAATKRYTSNSYYTEGLLSNLCVYSGSSSGKSAYDIAVESGFGGTEKEWLVSLVGEKGKDGVGVADIALTATKDGIDTYTIYLTDGSASVFTVNNGKAVGAQGEQGIDGRGISGIKKTNTGDLVDTYTITYTDNTSSTFTVTNGKEDEKGEQGEQGEQGNPGEQGKQGGQGEQGKQGEQGNPGDAGRNGKTDDEKVTKGKIYSISSRKYQVTTVAGSKAGTVTYTGTEKAASVSSITLGKTVKIDGKTYKVTAISDKAFKNNKKLKKVTIGANITSIGKEAFAGCKVLKSIIIKSKNLKKIDKSAIKGIHKKATIKVPASKVKAYKKLFKSSTGFKKSMKLKK